MIINLINSIEIRTSENDDESDEVIFCIIKRTLTHKGQDLSR